MKLASFVTGARSTWGVVDGDGIRDVGAVIGDLYPDLGAVLTAQAWRDVRGAVDSAPRLALSDIEFAPVVVRPNKILCIGHNYESHRQETGRAKVDHPSIFVRFPDSQVGHDQPLVRPRVSTQLDFEGELAVVIGRPGRMINEQEALNHVAGYACYMDGSVRDWQWHTQQFTPGKTFPGTGGFGPWLVTAEEIPDPQALSVTTRLNGEVMQAQPTSEMIFPVATLIAYISTFTPLAPGDVIVTGTPGGVGAKRQPPVWMKPGDVVEVDIPGVGLLRHSIIDEL